MDWIAVKNYFRWCVHVLVGCSDILGLLLSHVYSHQGNIYTYNLYFIESHFEEKQ